MPADRQPDMRRPVLLVTLQEPVADSAAFIFDRYRDAAEAAVGPHRSKHFNKKQRVAENAVTKEEDADLMPSKLAFDDDDVYAAVEDILNDILFWFCAEKTCEYQAALTCLEKSADEYNAISFATRSLPQHLQAAAARAEPGAHSSVPCGPGLKLEPLRGCEDLLRGQILETERRATGLLTTSQLA